MKVRSLRMTFEDQFINGDESTNPRAFDGLRRRINTGSSQAISMGGALSLSQTNSTTDIAAERFSDIRTRSAGLTATLARNSEGASAVLVLVKGGSLLFRKRVMKSGGAGREKRRKAPLAG